MGIWVGFHEAQLFPLPDRTHWRRFFFPPKDSCTKRMSERLQGANLCYPTLRELLQSLPQSNLQPLAFLARRRGFLFQIDTRIEVSFNEWRRVSGDYRLHYDPWLEVKCEMSRPPVGMSVSALTPAEPKPLRCSHKYACSHLSLLSRRWG
jgi:hypothetical protein